MTGGWTRRSAIGAGLALSAGLSRARAANLNLTGDISPVHDPCIIFADGLYHVFCTSRMAPGRGLIDWRTSPDLTQWTLRGQVLAALPEWVSELIPDTRGVWAPDISYVKGRYRLYYACSLFGENRSVIGLVSTQSLDPAHPQFGWRDDGQVLQSRDGDRFNAIDPNRFEDQEGRQWLAFGSFWDGIMLSELDPASLKPKDSRAPVRLAVRADHAIEAPFLIFRNGWYYLFASCEFCCRGANSTYFTIAGRSRHVEGPYLGPNDQPMLAGGGLNVLDANHEPSGFKGPGHCAILQTPERDLIVYHAYNLNDGGRPYLRIRALSWRNGWPRAE